MARDQAAEFVLRTKSGNDRLVRIRLIVAEIAVIRAVNIGFYSQLETAKRVPTKK